MESEIAPCATSWKAFVGGPGLCPLLGRALVALLPELDAGCASPPYDALLALKAHAVDRHVQRRIPKGEVAQLWRDAPTEHGVRVQRERR
jgi:hypothetical protein